MPNTPPQVVATLAGSADARILRAAGHTRDTPANPNLTGLEAFGVTGAFAGHYPYTDGLIYDGWGSNARKDAISSSQCLAPLLPAVRIGPVGGEADKFKIFTTTSNTVSFSGSYLIGVSRLAPTSMRD